MCIISIIQVFSCQMTQPCIQWSLQKAAHTQTSSMFIVIGINFYVKQYSEWMFEKLVNSNRKQLVTLGSCTLQQQKKKIVLEGLFSHLPFVLLQNLSKNLLWIFFNSIRIAISSDIVYLAIIAKLILKCWYFLINH